jgi:hypothetical protein
MEEFCFVPWMKLQTITSPFGIGNEGSGATRSQRLRYKAAVIDCDCYDLLTPAPSYPLTNYLIPIMHGLS